MSTFTPPTATEAGRDVSVRFRHKQRTRLITVVGAGFVSDTMARVRFTGEGLRDLDTLAPTDHVKLFFDKDENGDVVMPRLVEGWPMLGGHTYRDFTVRAFDPRGPYLDIDFVVHGHGVAARWAEAATPGQQLGMLGPRSSHVIYDLFDSYVFAADESGLPALARWVEQLRPEAKVTAYVEVTNSTSEIELSSAADLHVQWLHRASAAPGTTDLLEQAVRAHPISRARDTFVWVAGEAMTVEPLRDYLTRELELETDTWVVDGYWRRGVVNYNRRCEHHR